MTEKKKSKLELECNPNSFSNLPIDIIFNNILTRLPIKSISNCRYVSKSWYNFILNPTFTHLHFSISKKSFPCAIFPTRYTRSYLIDPDSISRYETSVVAYDLNLKEFRENFTISNGWNCFDVVGTVNGLVCFSPEAHDYEPKPYYIVNPITRDYTLLPKSPKIDIKPVGSGFGFDSIKNEYKVVRILPNPNDNDDEDEVGNGNTIEIYTMGSGAWREIQLNTDVQAFTIMSMTRSYVIVNGCLHWKPCVMIESEYHTPILCFDMAREEFNLIKMPPLPMEGDMFRFLYVNLIVLNDCLCAIDGCCYTRGSTGVWIMKKYGVHTSWVKEYVIKTNISHSLWHGGHEALELKNNELLLVDKEKNLIYYDFKKKSSKRITLHDIKGNRVHEEADFLVCLEGSLLSPKAIESNRRDPTCRAERN